MQKTGKVIAVCRSDTKGVSKNPVPSGEFRVGFGMVTDAHADCTTHRQVSLLADESIDKMRKMGLTLNPGAFAENLTTRGIELVTIPIGTKVKVGNAKRGCFWQGFKGWHDQSGRCHQSG
jgi:MOSC domain-containing protein YiiM